MIGGNCYWYSDVLCPLLYEGDGGGEESGCALLLLALVV